MIKIVTLFLIGMALLAIFGKLRRPFRGGSGRCQRCGAPLVGRGPCPCDKRR